MTTMQGDWKLVIVESPYTGNVEFNVNYARRCIMDCLHRGEAAIASHLLYTQQGILRDDKASERKMGIEAGIAWKQVAEYSAFYTDLGWSHGMLTGLNGLVQRRDKRFRIRAIDGAVRLPAFISPEVEQFLLNHVE